MHDRVRIRARQRVLDFLSIRQIALDENSPRVHRAAMAFGEIVKDRDLVAFIEEQLSANTPNITRAADDENFHPEESRRLWPLINPAHGWKAERPLFSAARQSS